MTCIHTAICSSDASMRCSSTTSSRVARPPGPPACSHKAKASRPATTWASSHPRTRALRDRIDAILRKAMHDGRLEAIFRKWDQWNDDQPQLYARLLASGNGPMWQRMVGAIPDSMPRLRLPKRKLRPMYSVTCPRSFAPRESRSCSQCWRWRLPLPRAC